MFERIENCLIERRILFPHELQFGFREDYGAVPACFVLKECISFDVKKWSLFLCFLDNEKAFDRIWHKFLLFLKLGKDPYIWFILKDWYYNSKCLYHLLVFIRGFFKVSQCVGQGIVLRAVMFLVYMKE